MYQVMVKIRFPIIALLLVSLCACQPVAIPERSPAATPTPQVSIQGDNTGSEEIQTIELDNCDGKGDAVRIEQRSQSVEVTISAEIAAKLGASVEVISAEVQATVSASTAKGSQRSTSIQLSAPPQTHMIFQLTWTGREQIGVVQNLRGSNIPIAFRGFSPTDVRIRSQSDIGCPGSGASIPTTLTRALSTPVPSTLTPILPTPIPTSARIVVPGSAQDGITWCTKSNGVHEIRYESGAYSPWPTDEGCDPKGCWKGVIFVYKNSNPDSIFAGSSKGEPRNPIWQIGWNDWRKSLEEVEIASKSLEEIDIELRKEDCLTFIAIDGRDAYHFPGDNRGKITVSVKLP